LREAHRTAVIERLGRAAGNGQRVLEKLFDKPILTVSQVREMTGTTYAAANAMVQRMVEIGILEEMTGYARNRRFQYGSYVRLFTDEMPPAGADTYSWQGS
jgi:Fic family protein